MIHQSDWELLCCLYKHKSITKAAKALYITQPAITKRLMQLEAEFGVTIAIRNSKGLLFTPDGEYLADHARRMVAEQAALERRFNRPSQELFGTLHIASCNSLARFVLPPLLGQFKKKHPKVEFSLISEFSHKVSQSVNTQKAHLGFLRGDHANGCQHIVIRRQQACAVCSRPFDLAELADMPRISFNTDQYVISQIDAWWYDHFRTAPNSAITVSSGDTCIEMVSNGLGYALLLAEDYIRGKDGLYKLPLFHRNGTPMIRTDWMIYREESLELDLVRAFVEHTKDFVQAERADG